MRRPSGLVLRCATAANGQKPPENIWRACRRSRADSPNTMARGPARSMVVVVVVLGAAALLTGAFPASPDTAGAPEHEETVFYLGDPQIGFGSSGWEMDELRFAFAAQAATDSNATAVVVAGDLVNVWDNTTLISGFDKVWPTRFPQDRVHLVPGNHDVNSAETNASKFRQQLQHYHDVFGVDHHSFRTAHATFVLVNSELLIAPHLGLNGTADPWVLNQTETQWAWLEATLARARDPATGTAHTVVVTHHPPFLTSPDEPDVYWNWPLAVRPRLLGLLATYGVENVLCGHTHTTTNVTAATVNASSRLTIFTVAGTARVFDHHGCGYRKLRINASHVTSDYVVLDDPSLEACGPAGLFDAHKPSAVHFPMAAGAGAAGEGAGTRAGAGAGASTGGGNERAEALSRSAPQTQEVEVAAGEIDRKAKLKHWRSTPQVQRIF